MPSTKLETKAVLTAFAVSGGAALIYEVIWTRALSIVLGSTVYALSTMLSTFMGGLAIGAFLGGKLSDRCKNHLFLFGLCELGIGVLGLTSIPLIYAMPRVYLGIFRKFHLYPSVFFAVQIAMCAVVMLLPTMLMGATFPFVTRKITENLAEMGRKVGDAYSINTIGAVIGSLAVGFYLIPTFGIKGAAIFAAVLNLLVGGTMVVLGRRRRGILFFALPVFILVSLWSKNAYLETNMVNFYLMNRALDNRPFDAIVGFEQEKWKQIFFEEHPEGTVKAYKTNDGHLVLQVGGKVEGTDTRDITNTLLLAYLPIAAHPSPRNFLNIGLGAGVTLGAAKGAIPEVDVVEINPGVINAVAIHGESGVLDGVNMVVNDARNYLLTTDKTYDIISSEPSYPTESGVANLFTKEFYEIAATKLRNGGVYCQWLPYYVLTKNDVAMVLKTFTAVFPHAFLWKISESSDLIVLGSKQPFEVSADDIKRAVARLNKTDTPLQFSLSRTPSQLPEELARFDVSLNTDDHPMLEYRVIKNFLNGSLSDHNH